MAPTAKPQADPDPTTQIPWPASRNKPGEDGGAADDGAGGSLGVPHVRFTERNRSRSPAPSNQSKKKEKAGPRRLTFWDFVFLSVSMLGAQITWSVELGYALILL